MSDSIKGMLNAEQARVLGSLMEKQMTTPDYYPLTLKALTAACNQKSSRNPVMHLSESEVAGVISGLRSEGLVTARLDGRVDRYEQQLSRKLGMPSKQRAVLCVLMLRGPLTLNEIRINTSRMVEFADHGEIESELEQLMESDDPLVVRIPRSPGQREDRFVHLLCGEVEMAPAQDRPEGGRNQDRLHNLELEVEQLKGELDRLWALTGLPKE